MSKRSLLLYLVVTTLVWFATDQISAGTIPAGTSLVVRTLQAVSSQDNPGTIVPLQLQNNVTVDGKVVLHAGTHMTGKIITSRRTVSSTQKLTMDITQAAVSGRTVPIKTTGAVQLDATGVTTRNSSKVSRASYSVSVGRQVVFRLAHPIKF